MSDKKQGITTATRKVYSYGDRELFSVVGDGEIELESVYGQWNPTRAAKLAITLIAWIRETGDNEAKSIVGL